MKNKLGIPALVLALLVGNIFVFQSALAGTSGIIELSVEVSDEDKLKDSSFIKLAEITSFRDSITSSDIANKVGIAPDIVERDISDIKPSLIEDKTPSFPLLVIYGEGLIEDKEKFKFYIGKLKKVELEDSNLEEISVQYKGRLKFENRLDSYLIVEGNEEETLFKLVPVTNRQILEDESLIAKMTVNFKEKTGSFSNLFGIPGTIDFKITQLERKPLRPEIESARQNRIVPADASSVSQTEQSEVSIYSETEKTTEKERKDKPGLKAESSSEIRAEKQKRFSLVDWFKKLFVR